MTQAQAVKISMSFNAKGRQSEQAYNPKRARDLNQLQLE